MKERVAIIQASEAEDKYRDLEDSRGIVEEDLCKKYDEWQEKNHTATIISRKFSSTIYQGKTTHYIAIFYK